MFDFGFHFFNNSSGGVVPPPPSTDFIIKVKTDNDGTSNNDQFTLPTSNIGGTVYDYTIDWGDGVVENITTTTTQTHTYPTAGTYTITISGRFERIYFNNGGDKLKLIETVNFGDVGWRYFAQAFNGCTNNVMNSNCTGNFDLVTTAESAWRDNNLDTFPAIDFPLCTNFRNCWSNNNLTTFPLINMGSAISLESAWRDNNLDTFPAIDLPLGTNFILTWSNNNLTTFPLINMGSATSLRSTWSNNDLDTFPAIDLPNATNMSGAAEGAWTNNGVMSSFACRNFFNVSVATRLFSGTTLPTSDYSDILVTQRANNVNTGVTFHGGNSKYNPAGGVAREELVTIQNWNIIDGGAE